MKTKLWIALLGGLWLAGCAPKDPAPNEDVNALHEKFHGKYKAISSVSSEVIDVDLDGRASTDMIHEIPDLISPNSNFLELRIYGPSKYRSENSFLFTQWWPEQYIWFNNKQWEGEPIDYQPGLSVNYAMQGTSRYFSFTPDLSQLQVQPMNNENAFRWVFPQSVTVDKRTGTIQVVNKRRLYTSAGVKEVVITTVYQRYTMAT